MAGTGPVPKTARSRSQRPLRGEWQKTPGVGWQHGRVPAPPPGTLKQTREAWTTWMGAWYASHWTPDDIPGLRYVALLFDRCQRGSIVGSPPYAELRQMMDSYGITPKGQQDRRWLPPKPEDKPVPQAGSDDDAGPYAGLRVVGG